MRRNDKLNKSPAKTMVVFHRVGDLTLMLGHSGKKRSKSDRENSIGMKLVPVPASDFETGRDELAETLAVAYPWIRSTVCPNLIEVGYTFKL